MVDTEGRLKRERERERERERRWHRGGPGVDIIERLACHQSALLVVLVAQRPAAANATGDSGDAGWRPSLTQKRER